MNPWSDQHGCPVNVCMAKHCDVVRFRICALRKAWLERRDELRAKLQLLGDTPEADHIRQQLEELVNDQ